MDKTKFKNAVAKILATMLDASLETGEERSNVREQIVAARGPCRLALKPSQADIYRIVLARSQQFTFEENVLADHFVRELVELDAIGAGKYEPDLMALLPERVIGSFMGGRTALGNILQLLRDWSSRTYEGKRVAVAIGIDPNCVSTQISLEEYWSLDLSAVFSNGIDTLVVCAQDGSFAGLKSLPDGNMSRKVPYRLARIGEWAKSGRIAAVLNRHGEILVMTGGTLHFALRDGKWMYFSHDANIARMDPPKSRKLREAIYESCLDVSFARTGGCIGVVLSKHNGEAPDCVVPSDRLYLERNVKSRILNTAVSGVFQSLDRRLRSELLALDGALVCDHRGNVLAAGAILRLPGGSAGGGRLAAARTLSEAGLAIKISADGPIVVFKEGHEIIRT